FQAAIPHLDGGFTNLFNEMCVELAAQGVLAHVLVMGSGVGPKFFTEVIQCWLGVSGKFVLEKCFCDVVWFVVSCSPGGDCWISRGLFHSPPSRLAGVVF